VGIEGLLNPGHRLPIVGIDQIVFLRTPAIGFTEIVLLPPLLDTGLQVDHGRSGSAELLVEGFDSTIRLLALFGYTIHHARCLGDKRLGMGRRQAERQGDGTGRPRQVCGIVGIHGFTPLLCGSVSAADLLLLQGEAEFVQAIHQFPVGSAHGALCIEGQKFPVRLAGE